MYHANSQRAAFFRIFLVHSTLERFLEALGLKIDDLEPYLVKYNAEEVTSIIQAKDKDRKLYDFLQEKLNKNLKLKLHSCYEGECMNYAYMSASIRHIFAHGHLSANVNGVNPKNIDTICTSITDNLINFMDSEFTKKIDYGFEKMTKEA